MSYVTAPEPLRVLTARLPFDLEDTARVGAAFRRWRASAPGACIEEKRVVDLWTYCFVRRYFWAKFAASPGRPASDLEELVERTYQKIETGRAAVRCSQRYPHWVSVVCKNTYLNYVRRDHPVPVSLSREDRPPLPSGDRAGGDLGLTRKAVAAAIGRLPRYLQPVARLRFLESCSYYAINEKTGTAVPTARSYVSRARNRLREDPALRTLARRPEGG